MLEKAGQEAPASIGFAQASGGRAASTEVVLVARVRAEDLAKNTRLAEANVDAFLLAPKSARDSTLRVCADVLDGRVWGVRLAKFSAAQVRTLLKKGCDFIVFEQAETEAEVLNDETLGTVVTIGSGLAEEVIRATMELPLDAALFSPTQLALPLTVENLADIQRVLGLVGKPFLLEAPPALGRGDLEALRNLGIAGLSVDLASAGEIAELRANIDSLPRRRRRTGRSDALLPLVAGGQAGDQYEPDPGEDDDEDFD